MTEEGQIIELVEEPVGESAWQEGAPALRVVRLQEFESPYTLSSCEREPYLRRMTTLFVDDDRTRKGSTGQVLHATNAYGEQFALKVYDGSLDREYEVHRKVSGIKGYPALYGKALLEGKRALLMEWVEGEDLGRFASRLAIDDEGRLSPLLVARLGRDLFDVLARTSVLEGDLIHGDLSFRNVLVCTTLQSIDEQVRQGSFDLRLIDLGSAHFANEAPRRAADAEVSELFAEIFPATPQFAAPELCCETGDDAGTGRSSRPDGAATTRKSSLEDQKATPFSPAIDVYAASRILSFLLYGDDPSLRAMAHAAGADASAVLLREPEVAVAVNRVSLGLIPSPAIDEVREALVQVDETLGALLNCGLDRDPAKRPSAAQMRDALDSFCCSYVDNLGHALRGEDLDPFDAPFVYKGLDRLSLHARNAIRVVGKSLSLGLLVAVVAITSYVVGSSEVVASWGETSLEGMAMQALVVALVFPFMLGFVARGRKKSDRSSFVRGSIGVVLGAACVIGVIAAGAFDPPAFKQLFTSASFACAAMAWCPLVFDVAFPAASAGVRRSYRALPDASAQDRNDDDMKVYKEKDDDRD